MKEGFGDLIDDAVEALPDQAETDRVEPLTGSVIVHRCQPIIVTGVSAADDIVASGLRLRRLRGRVRRHRRGDRQSLRVGMISQTRAAIERLFCKIQLCAAHHRAFDGLDTGGCGELRYCAAGDALSGIPLVTSGVMKTPSRMMKRQPRRSLRSPYHLRSAGSPRRRPGVFRCQTGHVRLFG